MRTVILCTIVCSVCLSPVFARAQTEVGIDFGDTSLVETVDYEYELPYPGASDAITAGGLSGLWYAGDEGGMRILYTVSDRGPQARRIGSVPGDNPEDSRKNERIFDDPKFPTTVYKLALKEGRARTLDFFPLLMPNGTGGFRPATGIGQLDSDDGAWSPAGVGTDGFNEYSQISRDTFGIDAETGRLVQRLVPTDTDYSTIDYEHGRGEVSGGASRHRSCGASSLLCRTRGV